MSTTTGQLQLPSTNGHCPECAGIGTLRELSNEDRIKMIGNAVSSPVATMLGWAVVDSLR